MKNLDVTSSIIHQARTHNFLKHCNRIKTSLHRHLNNSSQQLFIINKVFKQSCHHITHVNTNTKYQKYPADIIKIIIKDRPLIRALSLRHQSSKRGSIHLSSRDSPKPSKLVPHTIYPSIRIRQAVNQTTTRAQFTIHN